MKSNSVRLGEITVDSEVGDILLTNGRAIPELAEKLGWSENMVLNRYGAVRCTMGGEGTYPVYRLTALDKDGNTYPAIMIGFEPTSFVRFLDETEPDFSEFFHNHPRFPEVDYGGEFNREVFEAIRAEYRQKVLKLEEK